MVKDDNARCWRLEGVEDFVVGHWVVNVAAVYSEHTLYMTLAKHHKKPRH